jgi:hypothetical protein
MWAVALGHRLVFYAVPLPSIDIYSFLLQIELQISCHANSYINQFFFKKILFESLLAISVLLGQSFFPHLLARSIPA